MRNLKKYIVTVGITATILSACKRDDQVNTIRSTPNSAISNLDLRRLYRGSDVTLNKETMKDASFVVGQVTSDHSGGNLPQGLLFVQNARNMGGGIDSLRGIAINLGAAAASFLPGDSVHIKVEGGILKRVNGILQVTGLSATDVEKKASGKRLRYIPVSTTDLRNSPERYESCLALIYNANFEPNIGVETLEGVKTFNEGSGDMQMTVATTATFKTEFLPYSANVSGIILPLENGLLNIRPRVKADFVATSLTVDASIPLGPHPVIITGFFPDPTGTDANHEYIQLMATQDLDFRQKPFSVFTTNNAGASTPTGAPINGWATGGLRSYKFNITRGTVAKGTFFYVGGNKLINGAGTANISNANWVVSKLYASQDGDDGIGDRTTNLLANTGNAAGMAVFPTTNVNAGTVPSDAVFYAGTGGAFTDGYGYAIGDSDMFKRNNGAIFQPFYRQGNNTARVIDGNPLANAFVYLGGTYDATLKQWITTARKGKTVLTPKALAEIENRDDVTKVIN